MAASPLAIALSSRLKDLEYWWSRLDSWLDLWSVLVVIGVALIVLPGPAFIVIPIGLSILASEFIWAQRVIKRGRIFLEKVVRVAK